MPRTRDPLQHRLPAEDDSPALRLRKIINYPPSKGQRVPGSGRKPGAPNHIPKYSQAVILEALHTFGRDGRGKDGIVGFIHRALHEDVRHGVSLLLGITPKLLEANITKRTDITFRSIAEVDSELAKHGLPPTREVFSLSYDKGPVDENDQ